MNINKYIDHTLLKPTATFDQISKLCEEAKKYEFASVCINPCFVKYAAEQLKGSSVKVCTVIGFPLGNTTTQAKVDEAKQALKDGADEFDMVLNQSWIKSNKIEDAQADIAAVRKAIGDKLLKVILETCNLTDDEIAKASQISEKAKADYVKTSTGFGSEGATPEAVKIMKANISDQVKIKASGGIRDLETAEMYINLGVSRLGASSGVQIMQGKTSTQNY
ncbi:deoxyribose-phosphate aldolase [Psychroflexus halocasei]|uniref:Deoxyribose-phosphate aldolase n=1 Tax=Psychroflexus halocasei TaxID=908615 RepID=A0A1H3WZT5_9FLAO|nr:deoxyribose-phosphate aldolase [Psychroflexus halocasei]SDZ91934.1 deoxyribose-phosphate aldolase [Psychroflexus halocasei]